MSRLHHKCPDCDSEFTITYRIENCEDDPTYCPFCGVYIIREEEYSEDDYIEDDD